MARIELSNIGGGTTLSLTTTGTSGASTLAGSVLNIPVYQGQLTLTTTGTSGAATLVGDTLNIPNYATGGNPAGSAGQVQFNSTPSGSFAASANLAWDNTAVQLNVGAPLSPTGKLNVKGSGATSSTVNTRLTDSGNTELLKVLDNGSTNIGANFNWDNVNGRLGLGTSTPNQTLEVSGAMRLTGTAGTAAFMLGRNSAGDVSTVTLGTTGTSGAATLSANVLNIPQYQGAVSLTTSGTSGASTFAANVLNIPQYQGALTLSTAGTTGASTLVGNALTIPTYQGQITLTTTGTSGAATLVGDTLNIPQYSGGGGGSPAGVTGEIQYNNAGAFGASANLAWDNSNVRLNIGAPSAPTGRLNIKGAGATTTVGLSVTNSSNTSLIQSLDNGNVGFGQSSPAATVHIRAQSNSSGAAMIIENPQVTPTGLNGAAIYATGNGQTTSGPNNSEFFVTVSGPGSSSISDGPFFTMRGNNYSRNANQRGWLFFYAGQVTSPTGNDGSIHFLSASSFLDFQTTSSATSRLRVYNNGEVGVGTGSTTPSARLQVRGANTTAAVGTFIVEDGAATPATIYRIDNDGKITYRATNTAAGTTGAQTINRPSGTVNFAAGATALVVTNSLCTTASLVFAEVRTNDATAQIKNVVPGSGSFTINFSAAATAETSVGFFIIN